MTYIPGKARVGEPTPQSDPDLFSDAEIRAEIKYLIRTNKRLGSHPLRTLAYLKLERVLAERHGRPDCRNCGGDGFTVDAPVCPACGGKR